VETEFKRPFLTPLGLLFGNR